LAQVTRTTLSAALALLALLGAGARADVIHYKDGRRLEGRITARTATELTVQTDFGAIRVPLSKVERIEEKATPREELATRRAALRDDDAQGLLELAAWAGEAGLAAERLALLREVVRADPLHVEANTALGRVRVDGRWLEPAEVEAWVAERAAEMEAQGLAWDGAGWSPIGEVMAARGLVRWKDAWHPRRAAEIGMAVEEAPAVLGLALQAATSPRVTLLSDLPPDDARDLVAALEGVLADVVERLKPEPAQLDRAFAFDLPVFLLPEPEQLHAFLDGPFADRYVVARQAREAYRDAWGFFVDEPRPLVVLRSTGEHIDVVADAALALRSFLANQLAVLGVRRLLHPRPVPGWLQAGLAALEEQRLTHGATLTITSFTLDADGHPVDPFLPGWGSFVQFEEQLSDPGGHSSLPPLRAVLRRPAERMDSRDVAMSWAFLQYLVERRPASLEEYARLYGVGSEGRRSDDSILHEAAFAGAFDESSQEVERVWKAWLLARPRAARDEGLFR
jgi:hypothetical protein